MHRGRRSATITAIVVALLGGACGDGTGGPSRGARGVEAVRVRTQAGEIPANPVTGDVTPIELQAGLVYRYRLEPGRAVRAIVVMVPGIASGATDFDPLARALLAASDAPIEVWAFERHPNLLEDLHGMEAAERARDVDLAATYYFGGGSVEGRRFDGFLRQEDVPFLSEWGLRRVMLDLRAAIELVPADRRRTNVVLLGHSLGVAQVLAYLGWDFDGDDRTVEDAGFHQLAGAVLLDAPIVARAPSLSRNEYEDRLARIRDGRAPRYDGLLPILAPEVLAFAEIVGMAAHPDFDDPADPDDGPGGHLDLRSLALPAPVESALDVLFASDTLDGWLGLPPTHRDFDVTNEALLGLLFDDDFQPWNPLQVGAGFLAPEESVRPRAALSFPLLLDAGHAPADPAVPYRWIDGDARGEPSRIATVAEAQWRGPTNYTEWYFAARPMLDASALGSLTDVTPADWPSAEHGLDLFHTARVDVPVLAIGAGAGMAPSPAFVEPIRAALRDPARDGSPRESPDAFEVRILPGYTHFDVLLADDSVPGGNGVVAPILDFVMRTTEGETRVP